MRASVIYRVAAALLVLFAAGHLLGFTQSHPKWGVNSLLMAMRSIRFDIGGFERTYWDFYLAAGVMTGVFFLFSAVLAWQLSSLQAEARAQMRGLAWAFAATFATIAIVSWIHLFLIPIVLSTVITLCLIAGAWRASR
jgi:hypothetical protein